MHPPSERQVYTKRECHYRNVDADVETRQRCTDSPRDAKELRMRQRNCVVHRRAVRNNYNKQSTSEERVEPSKLARRCVRSRRIAVTPVSSSHRMRFAV